MKLVLKRLFYAGLVLFALLQLVPYGRNHAADSDRAEPKWDSPRTRELAARACFDCHSNLTHWPWYTWVAPVSWLVQQDVDEGRGKLNFTAFDKRQRNKDECADQLRSREMPPWKYTRMHPAARLSDDEREELARGLERTFGDN